MPAELDNIPYACEIYYFFYFLCGLACVAMGPDPDVQGPICFMHKDLVQLKKNKKRLTLLASSHYLHSSEGLAG